MELEVEGDEIFTRHSLVITGYYMNASPIKKNMEVQKW